MLWILVLAAIFISGYMISLRFFRADLLPPSVLFGSMLYGWLLFLISSIAGFGLLAIISSAIMALAIPYLIFRSGRSPRIFPGIFSERDSLLVFLASSLLTGYAAFTVFDGSDGFSSATEDLAFHLGVISTLEQGNFPPQYPNFASQPLSYYYLPHLIAASLAKAGLAPVPAFQLLLTIFISAAIAGFFVLSRSLLKSGFAALLSILLMFLASPCTACKIGASAWFAPLFPPSESAMLLSGVQGFPFGPTLLSQAFYQFPLAFSFLFIAVFLPLVLAEGGRKKFPLAGIALGLLPMFNSFLFAALMAILLLMLIITRQKSYLLPLLISAALSLPQFIFLLPDKLDSAAGAVRQSLFANSQSNADLALFWLQNAGGHLVLAAIGFILWKKIDRRFRAAIAASFILFLLANFLAVSPNWVDSNKFFIPFLLMLNILGAYAAIRLLAHKPYGKAMFAALAVFALISAYYQFFIYFNPAYPQTPARIASAAASDACNWIRSNTPPGSIFLAPTELGRGGCLYALAGRKTFLSLEWVIRTHGYSAELASSEQQKMLSGDLGLLKQRKITHLFADSQFEEEISPDLMESLEPLYRAGGISVYKLNLDD